ncbi:hypothetical protein [Clostridium tagluense]|uniref:hypothetical protein n=1 Tax=Clostridium tagluense TaxID=360422 RepID=UPI001C0E041C|nr:hypothetical protein [Clostridium tagluense]MBU3126676.1 hypothetical protein [Clostridium tagluense]
MISKLTVGIISTVFFYYKILKLYVVKKEVKNIGTTIDIKNLSMKSVIMIIEMNKKLKNNFKKL